MKFKLDILIDLVPEKPGLLIPIFKIEGSNMPFVQEMNDAFEVYDMQPYLPADNYDYCLPENYTTTDVGEKGIIAFRSFDGSIFASDVSNCLMYRDTYRDKFANFPMLDLQLARVCGEPMSVMYNKWQAVGRAFLGPKTGKRWAESEFELYQKNRGIWDSIKEQKNSEQDQFLIDLNQHSFEYLFRWLVENNNSPNWKKIWLRAFKLSPFDERIYVIAQEWLRSKIGDSAFISETKLIIFCYLEYNSQFYVGDGDFKELLTEYLIENKDEIHEILYPNSFPALVFRNIDVEQDVVFFKELYFYFRERIGDDPRYTASMREIDEIWKVHAGEDML